MTSEPRAPTAEAEAEAGDRTMSVAAGATAGVAGLITFLILHHLWIIPIWFIAPMGLVLAAGGGAAVGAAYGDLAPQLPRPPWTAPALAALVAAMLAPPLLLAQLHGPVFAIGTDGRGTLLVPGVEAAVLIAGCLTATVLTGAVLGALIGRGPRAARSTAIAAMAIAIGPGHNIPMLGGTPAAAKELAILAAIVGVSSVILVEGRARLPRISATA